MRSPWCRYNSSHCSVVRRTPPSHVLAKIGERSPNTFVLVDEDVYPTYLTGSTAAGAWYVGDFSAYVPSDSTAILANMNAWVTSQFASVIIQTIPYSKTSGKVYGTVPWTTKDFAYVLRAYTRSASNNARCSKILFVPADGGKFLYNSPATADPTGFEIKLIGYWVPEDSPSLQEVEARRVLGHLRMLGAGSRVHASISAPGTSWADYDFTTYVPENARAMWVDVEVMGLDPSDSYYDQGILVLKSSNDIYSWSNSSAWVYGGASHLVQWYGGDTAYYSRHQSGHILRSDGGRFRCAAYSTSWNPYLAYVALRGWFVP